MERRSFVKTSMAAAAAAALSPKLLFAASGAATETAAAPESTETPDRTLYFADADVLTKLSDLVQSTTDCVKKGQACADHCKNEIAGGHTDFEKCNADVRAMMILCDATGKLAALKSVQTHSILNACISSLETCRGACLEHKAHFAHGMHLECKACAEACTGCIAQCKAVKKALTHKA